MTLYERYIGEETFTLLEILETSDGYTKECIDVIWEIFEFRKLNKSLVIDDVLLINKQIIRKRLDCFNPLQEKLEMHQSNFLDTDEMKTLYQKELKEIQMKEKIEGNIIGAAIGDGFGYPTEFMNLKEIKKKWGIIFAHILKIEVSNKLNLLKTSIFLAFTPTYLFLNYISIAKLNAQNFSFLLMVENHLLVKSQIL